MYSRPEIIMYDDRLTRAVTPDYLGDPALTHAVRTEEAYWKILQRGWDKLPPASGQPHDDSKPAGIWISINHSWENYCVDDYALPGWVYKRLVLNVALDPDTRLLKMDNPMEADFFRSDFPMVKRDDIISGHVDWQAVAEQYDGIYFANYYDMKKASPTWDGWDVDCVCVFDESKVMVRGAPVCAPAA